MSNSHVSDVHRRIKQYVIYSRACNVLTSPGDTDTIVKPWSFKAVAYLATTMFTAAFEMEYDVLLGTFTSSVKRVEPKPDVMTRTFFVSPARRRGRKALMVCVTPITLVLN